MEMGEKKPFEQQNWFVSRDGEFALSQYTIDTSIYQIIIDELVVCAKEANAKQKQNWSNEIRKKGQCKLFCWKQREKKRKKERKMK